MPKTFAKTNRQLKTYNLFLYLFLKYPVKFDLVFHFDELILLIVNIKPSIYESVVYLYKFYFRHVNIVYANLGLCLIPKP